jgi:predicted nucleic acid-binding protein
MIIIDTSAWIEYFNGTIKGKIVEKYLDDEKLFTPSIVLIELSCKSAKENWDFSEYLIFIKSKSSIIGLSEEAIIKCGKIYTEQRKKKPSFSMIDAIIWTLAEKSSAKILTGDNHFIDFKDVVMI